ncbi:hypothetical protein ACT17R_10380 [Sphingopyxis sp. Q841]|uniref:hypothetical protein n=1 Tax=Sphingopyxis sp. Q841 TaxID=3458250 RepID=UPI00403548EC
MQIYKSIMVDAGMAYGVKRHEFHEVVVPEKQVTATLVRMTARRPEPVFVVGAEGFPARMDFKRSSIEASDLLAHF